MNLKKKPKNATIGIEKNIPQPSNAGQSSEDNQPVNMQDRWHSHLYPDPPHVSER